MKTYSYSNDKSKKIMKDYLKQTNFRTYFFVLSLFLCFQLSAQGPNAPEASSFEPLDVTDVVNLVTGDFTYTIPTIEVPGPNGGYPLTLAYHAGIAMDQEASWVGLGWSLNPGAINRNVNGFPDDWDNINSYEYYWNKGETLVQHTVDISIPIGGVVSVGLGASWGSLRGFSGTVGMGVGIGEFSALNFDIGTNGASIGYGSKNFGANIGVGSDGFNASVGLKTGGQVGGSLGIGYSESGGFSGSARLYGSTNNEDKNGNLNKYVGSASLGITTNGAISYGLNASLRTTKNNETKTFSAGAGATNFITSLQQGDVTIKRSGFTIPLIFVNYRKEKIKWYVDKLKQSGISGTLFSDKELQSSPQTAAEFCEDRYGPCSIGNPDLITACACAQADGIGYGYQNTFNDIVELNISVNNENFSILKDNPVLLNHDGYNVSGQGMAGIMSPMAMKNMALFNVNNDFEEADLQYFKPNDNTPYQALNFYFNNELSGGAQINEVTFSDTSNPTNFDSYINSPATLINGNKRSSNFVEYFTYNNIPTDVLLPYNFSQPSFVNDNAVAGFRITAPDGVTYTYMLPVYNRLEKMRSFNYLDEERDVYSEKTNEAYATHWLLTSVTGPDYVDINANGELDENDYGYWVDFEYGKWSEGMVWRTPGKGDEYTKRGGARQYTWGLKELYYLDRISTRTHSALFVKELREDGKGIPQRFIYKNQGEDYTMPSQKQLKLNKIVLVQNDNIAALNKSNTIDLIGAPGQAYSFNDPKLNITYNFSLNLQDNILDINDSFVSNIEQNAVRVINFGYDYSLAQNSVNTEAGGKLTLKNLYFKGKGGVSLMPPYKFEYTNNPDWDYNDENYWGYNHHNATAWSMDEITTPQGTKVEVSYEGDIYENYSFAQNYIFRDVEVNANSNQLEISADIGNYGLKEGDEIYLTYDSTFTNCYPPQGGAPHTARAQYTGRVALVTKNQTSSDFRTIYDFELLDNNYTYTVQNTWATPMECLNNEFSIGAPSFTNISGTDFKNKNHAGIRVVAIGVSDNVDTWNTTYEYGTGSVPYEPFYNFQGVANQSLLRSPNVLYDKVTVRNLDSNDNVIDDVSSIYEFYTDNSPVEGIFAKLSTTVSSEPGTFNSFNANPTRDITFKYQDYQGIIGSQKTISVFQGNILQSKSTSNYKFLDESSGFVNTASTQMYKSVNPKPGNTNYVSINHLISTSYTKYPLVLESSEIIQGGIKNTTYFDSYDINSGSVLETRFFRSNEQELKTVTIPAYQRYGEMGSKEDDISNSHMLTQEAVGYTLLNKNGTWTPLNASITTWNNEWSYYDTMGVNLSPETNSSNMIWRKHESYIWDGTIDANGHYVGFNQTNDDGFNWSLNGSQSNAYWKKISTVGKYDRFSMPLEIVDVNNNKASTKMGDKNAKVFATGNAAYDELFYSGSEDLDDGGNYFGGGVLKGTATLSTDAHTGANSLAISSGQSGYEVTVRHNQGGTKKYKVSIWAKHGNHESARISVGGSQINYNTGEIVRAGDWVQLNFYADISSESQVFVTSSSGTNIIDDFRLHPISSSITSYVYNEWDELSHIIGSNNMAVKYSYDAMGRLIETQTEVADYDGPGTGGFKIATKNKYTYKY
jgi:hypothetical protein